MRIRAKDLCITLIVLTITLFVAIPVHAELLSDDTFIKLIKSSKPGVVHLSITRKSIDRDGRTSFQPGVGSGFFVRHEEKIKILTNRHVVENAIDVSVTMLVNGSERKMDAEIEKLDSYSDLALISLKTDPRTITHVHVLPIGESDSVEEGEWVLAIGSPWGLSYTSQKGMVSAIGRSVPPGTQTPPHDFIQIDADINLGNSGGPLLNLKGRIIGVVTSIYSRTGQSSGIGFAIPAKIVKDFLEIRAVGKGALARAGWIGIVTQTVEDDLLAMFNHPKTSKGLIVARVDKPSPAQEAGLRQGDLVISLHHKDAPLTFERPTDFEKIISGLPVGSILNMAYLRDGKEKKITIKVYPKP